MSSSPDDQDYAKKRKGQLTFDDYSTVKRLRALPSRRGGANARREAADQRKLYVRIKLEPYVEVSVSSTLPFPDTSPKGNSSNSNSSSRASAATKESGVEEASIAATNWSANTPLPSADFQSTVDNPELLPLVPQLKGTPIYYGGDIMKIMSFINKFHVFLADEIVSLSFQDFEIGLGLVPSSDTARAKLLADIMNLLFLSLLKLAFSTSKSTEHQVYRQPTAVMNQLEPRKKSFAKLVRQLRQSAREWGYPREWRVGIADEKEILEPKSKMFAVDDDIMNSNIDPTCKEVLTSNIYVWNREEPIPLEENPLYNNQLGKIGILALGPENRLILLRSMVHWCCSYSSRVRNEIHYLSHINKNPAFGTETHHVAKYLIDGPEKTITSFHTLCDLIVKRFDRRSKRREIKNDLAEGKRKDLSEKLKVLSRIKQNMKKVGLKKKHGRDPYIEQYWDWCILFENEIFDNPLSSPFADDMYKLRSQEFFAGRIPNIGDFYIPRLHTYLPELYGINTFTDVLHLKTFLNYEEDMLPLYAKNGRFMSKQFKLLFHDTVAGTKDTMENKLRNSNGYWYEVCNDCNSLNNFLQILNSAISDYKKLIKQNREDLQETLQRLLILKDYLTILNSILLKFQEFDEKIKNASPELLASIAEANKQAEEAKLVDNDGIAQNDDAPEAENYMDYEEFSDTAYNGENTNSVTLSREERLSRRNIKK